MGICSSSECKHDFDIRGDKIFCVKCKIQKTLEQYPGNVKKLDKAYSLPTENDLAFYQVPNNDYKFNRNIIPQEQSKQMPKGSLMVNIYDIPKIRKESIELSKLATQSDNEGRYDECLILYKQCLEKLDILVAKDDNAYYQDLYKKKINEYKSRINMV